MDVRVQDYGTMAAVRTDPGNELLGTVVYGEGHGFWVVFFRPEPAFVPRAFGSMTDAVDAIIAAQEIKVEVIPATTP